MPELRSAPPLPEILPRCRKAYQAARRTRTGLTRAESRPGPPLGCRLISASGLHWVLLLRGEIEAVLEYDARRLGLELVKIDSRVVCRESTFWGYNRHFAFTFPGTATPGELEVRTSLWSAVTTFDLWVSGVRVFQCETSIETCTLPVPASVPEIESAELPLPHL